MLLAPAEVGSDIDGQNTASIPVPELPTSRRLGYGPRLSGSIDDVAQSASSDAHRKNAMAHFLCISGAPYVQQASVGIASGTPMADDEQPKWDGAGDEI
jgi:hypothetical protein